MIDASIIGGSRARPGQPQGDKVAYPGRGTLPADPAGSAEFSDWYSAAMPGMLRYARRFAGTPEAAEDLVQEAMLRAWRDRGSHDGQPPAAWLRRVICNLAIDHARRERARPGAELRHTLSRVFRQPDLADTAADRVTVASALAGLPQPERQAVALRYLCDLPAARAAETIGVPLGTVKTRTRRGLSALRTEVSAA